VVGGGPLAESKAMSLREAGARVRVVESSRFRPRDLDDCWLAVSAATSDVNRRVADAARSRRIFVVAVDDPSSSTAHGVAVVRRAGVTLGISTDGRAPALSGLLREALERILPEELSEWTRVARSLRENWRREGVPMAERRPLLLRALNEIYAERRAGGKP